MVSHRYITRFKVKDSSRHVILGSQQFKPLEFANQINLSMDNAWGIVRCIIDLVMQQKDGKVIVIVSTPYIRSVPFVKITINIPLFIAKLHP